MKEILNALISIEASENITILYAAESGSRAWGFASPNSDYDVRFIYTRPLEYYLTFNVELHRDVIEVPIDENDFDIRGWDIRKALHLFTRSNGALLEWLRSPIRYREPHTAIERLTELGKHAFDATALMYHYFRMGKKNAREFLRDDVVSLKKYLYVVRCLVAVDFIRTRGELPPVNFLELLKENALDTPEIWEFRDAAQEIVRQKRESQELGTGSRIPELDTYISKALESNEKEFDGYRKGDLRQRKWDNDLNQIFRSAIGYQGG